MPAERGLRVLRREAILFGRGPGHLNLCARSDPRGNVLADLGSRAAPLGAAAKWSWSRETKWLWRTAAPRGKLSGERAGRRDPPGAKQLGKATQRSDESLVGGRRSAVAGKGQPAFGIVRPFVASASAPQRGPASDTDRRETEHPFTAAPDLLSRLLVRAGRRLVVVRLEEVGWIEAEGNYARLHGDTVNHRYRRTLDSLESRLDSRCFVRTHRSAIVNVDRIRELRPAGSGGYEILLRDGTRVPLSRSYRSRVFAVLGKE